MTATSEPSNLVDCSGNPRISRTKEILSPIKPLLVNIIIQPKTVTIGPDKIGNASKSTAVLPIRCITLRSTIDAL